MLCISMQLIAMIVKFQLHNLNSYQSLVSPLTFWVLDPVVYVLFVVMYWQRARLAQIGVPVSDKK